MEDKVDFRLYVIGSQKVCAPKVLPLVLKQAIQTGVKAVQLREKDLSPRKFFELSEDVQHSVSRYGAKVIINDRADIAAAVGAAGVQLTEDSIPVPMARRILGDNALIGVSVHSAEKARAAEDGGADFILFGPIFLSASHSYASPVGCKSLEQICSQVTIPVFAVGGIKPENVAKCLEYGAHGVACISSVIGADSIRSAVRAFKRELKEL